MSLLTLTHLAREGKLPAFKVGGVWRVRKDQFELWIEQEMQGTTRRQSRISGDTILNSTS